jgi:hypothetical protein
MFIRRFTRSSRRRVAVASFSIAVWAHSIRGSKLHAETHPCLAGSDPDIGAAETRPLQASATSHQPPVAGATMRSGTAVFKASNWGLRIGAMEASVVCAGVLLPLFAGEAVGFESPMTGNDVMPGCRKVFRDEQATRLEGGI